MPAYFLRLLGLLLASLLPAAGAQSWGAEGASLRLGVLPLIGSGNDADRNARLAIEDQLQNDLAGHGEFTVLERSAIQGVLSEQSLQADSLTDTASAVRLGQLLQADALVVGACRPSGDGLLVTVRLVRISDAEVLWAGEAEGKLEALVAQCPGLADACAAALAKPHAAVAGDAKQASLDAIRHHDRAQALHAQGLQADAVGEELLAQASDKASDAAAVGCAQALADAGLPQLAAADAQDCLVHHHALSAADAATLHALAGLTSPPPTQHPPRPASPLVRGMQAVIDRLKELSEDDPQVQRDLITVYGEMGKECALENRDHAALAAYEEAMTRKRALLRKDPRFFMEETWWGVNDDPTPLSPTTSLGEQLARMRLATFVYGNGFDRLEIPTGLPDAVARVRRAFVASSDFAPPRVARLTESLTDCVWLTGLNSFFLMHVPLDKIPDGGVVIAADLVGNPHESITNSMFELGQTWVGSEVDVLHARAGVPWITYDLYPNGGTQGRMLPIRGFFRKFAKAISWEVDHRQDAHGLALNYAFDPREQGAVQLTILYAVPPGAALDASNCDATQLVIDGVCALIDGHAEEAKTLLTAAAATPTSRFDIGREVLAKLIPMCADTP